MMKGIFFALATSLFVLVSCSDHNSGAGRTEIIQALNNQQQAWNDGDIDGFMAGYWKNDSLMFVSGDHVSYGWQKVTDNYKSKYATKDLMGELSFDIVKLDQLSSDAYLMIGSWKLERMSGNIGGKFSLLWRLVNGEWVVVIDHTS